MELSAEIRRRREASGLSLRQTAQMVGVDPAYLSRVERGLVAPSDALLRGLAKALGADPAELLLLAGRLPDEWQRAVATAPERATQALRLAVSSCVGEARPEYKPSVVALAGTRAIEDSAFPFEHLSKIAELESWRKEVNRPIYHVHKWWAQRLGSVFRAILLGTFAPVGSDILRMLYQPARVPGAVVYDPFAGSGTTLWGRMAAMPITPPGRPGRYRRATRRFSLGDCWESLQSATACSGPTGFSSSLTITREPRAGARSSPPLLGPASPS